MSRNTSSETRQHILAETLKLITQNGEVNVRVVDVAKHCNVGIPTIYYHFRSISQLVAETQLLNYAHLTQHLHGCLSRAEVAAHEGNENLFWTAIKENLDLAWIAGQAGGQWGIVKLLIAISKDMETWSHFCKIMEEKFERWVNVVETAKNHGWIDREVDSQTLIGTFWSASIGQVIVANSHQLNPTTGSVRDFFIKAVRSDRKLLGLDQKRAL